MFYDIGFMDWSDMWIGVSNWGTLTFDKACQMD